MDTAILQIQRGDQVMAWTTRWIFADHYGHTLLAVPRLRLSRDTTIELVHQKPYNALFREARIQIPGGDERTVVVVHASFVLYTTGEPEISNFGALLPDLSLPLPPPGTVIHRTAAMLR